MDVESHSEAWGNIFAGPLWRENVWIFFFSKNGTFWYTLYFCATASSPYVLWPRVTTPYTLPYFDRSASQSWQWFSHRCNKRFYAIKNFCYVLYVFPRFYYYFLERFTSTVVLVALALLITELRCQHGALRCDSGRCVPSQLICNGHIDCGLNDTSDERTCPGRFKQ